MYTLWIKSEHAEQHTLTSLDTGSIVVKPTPEDGDELDFVTIEINDIAPAVILNKLGQLGPLRRTPTERRLMKINRNPELKIVGL